MKSVLTFLSLFIFLTTAAQVPEPHILWIKGYGGNGTDQVSRFVTKTNEEGIILRYETNSIMGTGNLNVFCEPPYSRMVFAKYNADASLLEWSKCYGYGGDSFLVHVFPSNSGNSFIGGQFTSSVAYGFLVTKQDYSGNTLWQRNYSKGNSVFLRSMMACEDGGYVLAGTCTYTDTNVTIHYGSLSNADILLLKVDSNGYKIWSKVIGGSGDETVYNIINAPGDGCYLFGTTQSDDYDCTGYHGGIDAYLARIDKDGNILWHRDLGGSSEDGGIFGQAVSNGKGGAIITVYTESTDGDVHNHIGSFDYWVVETDSVGNILWDNCFGSAAQEYPTSVCKATDESIWVTGTSFTAGGQIDASYGNGDAWVVHMDETGHFLNAKVLGSSKADMGQMIYALPDGLVLTGGIYDENNYSFSSLNWYGENDVFLAVFAPWSAEVNQIPVTGTIQTYPNPASKHLTLSITSNARIAVRDITGREWYNAQLIAGKHSLDISLWPRGIYAVQTINAAGITEMQKLIVQ